MSLCRTPPRRTENPEDVKQLTMKRGQIKAKVTRIFNTLYTAEDEHRRLPLPLLRVYSKNLQVIYTEYNDVHNTITASVEEENVQVQEEKYIEFEDLYNETLVKVESMIGDLEKENRVVLSNPVPSTSSAANQPSSQPVIVNTHSYRTPLPTFDGRCEAWPRFKAMFQDMMQRSNDSDAIKLYHLENSLKGDAGGVIDIETLQSNDYARAWEILEERFGNQRLIIESHILALLNMQKISKKSSKDLRSLVDECSRHVDNLIKLDQRLSGMSQMFVVTLLTRVLDDQTRELWEASINQSELPEYEQMIHFLKQRCVILERCENSTPATRKFPDSKIPSSKPDFYKSSYAATVSSEYTCDVCSGQHQNFRCPGFKKLTVKQRYNKLKTSNLCFNCLRKGHHSAACRNDKSCRKCSKRHHTLIHFEWRKKSDDRSSKFSKVTEMYPAPANTKPPVNLSFSRTPRLPNKQVFLMTAMVTLHSKDGQAHQVRALLDSGSQVNLLSKSVVKKLNLQKCSTNVPVVGVGSVRSQIRHQVAVTIASNYSDFTATIDCLVTPKIAGTIPSLNVNVDSWGIPTGLELADETFNRSRELEMLIGVEHFFNILKQGQIKLADHLPTFYETQFGWAVAGPYETIAEGSSTYSDQAVSKADSPTTRMSSHVQTVPEHQRFPSDFGCP
ncbi:uncharacterized protein LOC134290341 [Aedes albopictus]|uniref:Peptidase A2 domain-containing protein n=1 Tax=Aedes albopictus TaxID=7160 RepID=A0ABM2A5W5_AEDAL